MKRRQAIAIFLLRVSLAAGFLSAVASRLGLWGKYSSGWKNFLAYTGEVNAYAPRNLVPVIAIVSTVVETTLGLLLLVGYQTSRVAGMAALLTLLFAIAMTVSFGIKEPLDYSVFGFSAGAFLLATMPVGKWGVDKMM